MSAPYGNELAPLLVPPPAGPAATLTYRSGVVLSWNQVTGENVVLVDGTEFTNMKIQNSSEIRVLTPGATVSILVAVYPSGMSTYMIMGRVLTPGTDEMEQVVDALGPGAVAEYVTSSLEVFGSDYTIMPDGPVTEVTVRASGRVLVLVSALITLDCPSSGAAINRYAGGMSFVLAGANVLNTGGEERELLVNHAFTVAIVGQFILRATSATWMEGLTPGVTRFIAMARNPGDGQVAMADRSIVVLPT